MQKLAPLTVLMLIEKISFVNADPITEIFCYGKLTLIR